MTNLRAEFEKLIKSHCDYQDMSTTEIEYMLEAYQAGHKEALEGFKVTEQMHIAAIKVLHESSGIDELPQRMFDAMLAAAPKPEDKT